MFSITIALIVVTTLISIVAFGNHKVQEDLLFWPAAIRHRNQYYRFITCGFVHFDVSHLLLNMLSFYAFGEYLELGLFSSSGLFGSNGKLFFLGLYLSAIAVAVIPDYFIHRRSSEYRSLGASGAVSAVIFSCILLKPLTPVGIILIPIQIPGFMFAILFLVISAVLARTSRGTIAHGAHLAGALYGIVYTSIAAKLYADFNAIKVFIHILRFDWLQ
ncbi:MAG: rhomboid family intramembrane serine protease [Williamsia sp.]|nr:rhomboid family intramembrane serine protease [Williamsia sp.]